MPVIGHFAKTWHHLIKRFHQHAPQAGTGVLEVVRYIRVYDVLHDREAGEAHRINRWTAQLSTVILDNASELRNKRHTRTF